MRFLVISVIFGLVGVCVHAARPAPNVIFILADDMGFSDVGCYGGEIETPHLDELAANGLRFTQFYNTGRCWPTRASLLSGYYAQQIGADRLPNVRGGMMMKRPEWARLLPEMLKSAGYRSYMSGKWHINGKVLAGGFDRALETRNSGNFFTAKGYFLDDKLLEAAADEVGFYATIGTVDHAIDCLKDHAANFADRPFFHYVPFLAPHFPLHALPEDIAKYEGRYVDGWEAMREARFVRMKEMGIIDTTLSAMEREVGPPYAFPEAMKILGPDEVDRPVEWDELSPGQRRFQATKMAIHAAMVDRMDQEIGRIIAQLKEMGAYDNTIIFFASDNGATSEIMVRGGGHDPQAAPGSAASYLCLGPGFSSACNTPFRRHKTWMHEGGIATPLIVHWPAGISAKNETRRTLSHVIDFVPTVLDLAGIAKPAEWNGVEVPVAPGKSLVPAFSADQVIERESMWWMHEQHRAVRVGEWKLVADAGKPWELYDMRTDRAEQIDLAGKMPERVKQLEAIWQKETDSFTALLKKKAGNQIDKAPSPNE